MIPLIKHLQFETNTEDYLEFKRTEVDGKSDQLLGKRHAIYDLKFQGEAKKALLKRLK